MSAQASDVASDPGALLNVNEFLILQETVTVPSHWQRIMHGAVHISISSALRWFNLMYAVIVSECGRMLQRILWSNHARCKNVLQPATLLNCLLLKIKEQLVLQRPLPWWPAQCSWADVCITGDIRGTIKYFNSLFRGPRLDECKSELLVTPETSVPHGLHGDGKHD